MGNLEKCITLNLLIILILNTHDVLETLKCFLLNPSRSGFEIRKCRERCLQI